MYRELTIQELEHLDALLDIEEGLNEYELSFIDKVAASRNGPFSLKQIAFLEKTYDLHCS